MAEELEFTTMAYDDWTTAQKQALDTELRTDPKGWGYATMANDIIAKSLNTVIEDDQDPRYTTGRKQVMTVDELRNLVATADFVKINNTAKQTHWGAITASELVDVRDDETYSVRVIKFIFDAGSPTDVAFTAALVIPVSRTTAIGIPTPNANDILVWRINTGGF